jgi:hypothetical protein
MNCAGFYHQLDADTIIPHAAGIDPKFLAEFACQSCSACGRARLLSMPLCPYCHSGDAEWVSIANEATLYAWTTTHHPMNDGWSKVLPYTVVTVDNLQGIRLHVPLCLDANEADLSPNSNFYLHREKVRDFFLPVAHPLMRL